MHSPDRIPRWMRLAGKRGWLALTGVVAVIALLGVGLASFLPSSPGPRDHSGGRARTAAGARPAAHGPSARPAAPGPVRADAHGQSGPAAAGPHTSCRAVAHVGDSTSVGLVSAAFLPNAGQRMPAQYQRVGVASPMVDAVGGRSVVEAIPGTVNGYDAAQAIAARGFHGCWVIALGTNDTADVAAGSSVSRLARIQEMMALAHGQPVLWVNVKTLDTSGPYAETNMRLWNAALDEAARQYPNLRIYDWASAAQSAWFAPDGIHYTSDGYAMRAQLIADALAKAFPFGGHSGGVYVK